MNIFNIIQTTTSRIEPFHTNYLASSLDENKELLDKFWVLATKGDPNWAKHSAQIKIKKEDVLDGGKRIDLVLLDASSNRLVAVEAKTTDSSVEDGQLDSYLALLERKYPGHSIWMSYLTPFNDKNRPAGIHGQKAIKEFERFKRFHPEFTNCAHLSWKEVTELENQTTGDVWIQHSEFVNTTICKPPTASVGWGSLDDDLGWETMRDFWQAIDKNGLKSSNRVIELRTSNDPWALSDAMKLLLSSENIRPSSKCPRKVEEGVKVALLNSAYGQFHQQIFQLLNEYPFLGIHGTGGYGLSIPVKGIHKHVSICTVHLRHPERLEIGRPPR